MSSLRALRTSRSLTFLDLAHLSGIPARTLAEAEYDLRPLSRPDQEHLAFVLGVRASDLAPPRPHARAISMSASPMAGAPALIAAALSATLATAAIQSSPLQLQLSRPAAALSQPAPTPTEAVPAGLGAIQVQAAAARDSAAAVFQARLAAISSYAAAPVEPIAPALLLGPAPAEPAPQFQLGPAGPIGCPIQPAQGRVVITQGYGVGSHAPAAIWGAVDLAVDADGDGYAEPGPTWYTPVVATHAGAVRVTLDSYPAGNHVWVEDVASGWRSGYAHLAIVTVISGQQVRPGQVIGMIGSSGKSSGPHLDYQVWRGGENIDPTGLVDC